MADEQCEREDKYDVEPGFVAPDFADLSPAGGRLEYAEINLESLYYDTDQHDLVRNHVTLRRRSGDADVGWQLKVPAGVARTEIRLPPTPGSAVPKELRDLTRGIRRDRPLRPVAILDTTRRATRIIDENGDPIVEIADDSVRATVMGAAALISEWREIEVELGTGDEHLLSRIGKRLRRAGAEPATSGSKIARALALADVDVAAAPRTDTGAERRLLDYIAEQHAAIMQGDLTHRRGGDAVHATRVATRRLRSVLRVFGDLFDPDLGGTLDGELAWLGSLLGAVRDRQVQRGRFAREIGELPGELVLGPVSAHLEQHLLTEELRHRRALLRAMNGARYFALLDNLTGWLDAPPVAKSPVGPKTLVRLVGRAERKVRTRLDAALASSDDTLLHRARKAAKRARYALEATGGPKRCIKRYKQLQGILGEHQDSVDAMLLLRALGAAAGTTAGENGFTYGLLYGREETNARDSRGAAAKWKS
ncbi:MAG: hypothetical protein JWO57_4045 [Pseudonocardiales bacterium]|nr:hypothetical protein [Pseudonocardiales bacterium]